MKTDCLAFLRERAGGGGGVEKSPERVTKMIINRLFCLGLQTHPWLKSALVPKEPKKLKC